MDLQFLNQVHPLTIEDQDLLRSRLQLKLYPKGDYILQAGDVQSYLYFVQSGIQMAYLETPKKMHILAFTYAPGVLAVPDSFALQIPSRYAVRAISDSELWRISFQDLQFCFDQSQSIERLFRKLTEMILAGLIDRFSEWQAFTIEERFRLFSSRSAHLFNRVPHKYLASYLDIDATNFSKLYNSIKI